MKFQGHNQNIRWDIAILLANFLTDQDLLLTIYSNRTSPFIDQLTKQRASHIRPGQADQ